MSQPGAPMPPPPQWSTLPASSTVSIPWSSLVTWGRILGFVLIFLGTIVAVAFASFPSNCLTTPVPSSCTSFASQWANAVMWGKILWVIGLFFIGGATGIRMNRRWGGKDMGNEDGAGAVQRGWANLAVIVLCILLMAAILFTINICPPIGGGGLTGFGGGTCPGA
ncbi:MAG: hypothetical protein L3J93_01295 [Thermoplasmata archaeon]|nr:hypothetical protein [Thermoplasmata archaeon]